ncbi:hypothetical protein JVT61DRAFT_8268 [Boletus reticuloceps]|uniref:NAD(P)-binding protein n=1 Tax=Boletus reticuloceps TaxID=495285 RepID=A0A8I2YVR2_9AGAM|nr:hypothetical protein JVT61DRAFT_8268 [Boletus reticuloceps]
MSAIRPLFVVAGIGNGSGLYLSAFARLSALLTSTQEQGLLQRMYFLDQPNAGRTNQSYSRLFAKLGYSVALISRGPEHLNKLASEINQNRGEAVPFPVPDYTPTSIRAAFSSIRTRFPVTNYPLRVALFNAGYGVWKPFLDITEEEVRQSLDVNVLAAFSFSREVLLEFTKNDLEQPSEGGKGGSRKKGTLIFTGATAGIRGNTSTSAFAAGKFGLRALSQSLAKEFGKQNIHSIIDGNILTDRARGHHNDPAWEANADTRLDPDSIAKRHLIRTQRPTSVSLNKIAQLGLGKLTYDLLTKSGEHLNSERCMRARNVFRSMTEIWVFMCM